MSETQAASQSVDSRRPPGSPKRRLRNFLLDARFQLKYTGMVVAVTVAVAGVLGYFAYGYSTGQTELMTIMQLEHERAVAPELAQYLEMEARKADRKVLLGILGGIALLTLALGITGIVITHRVVGPAYKIRRLLNEVRDGKLEEPHPGIRKGDELQDVFVAFEQMVRSLRANHRRDMDRLDAAYQQVQKAGASSELLLALDELRQDARRRL